MQTEGFCDGFCDEQEDRTEQLCPQTQADGVYSSQGRQGAGFSPEVAPAGVTQAGSRAGGGGGPAGLGDRRPCTLLIQLGEHLPPPPSGCESS